MFQCQMIHGNKLSLSNNLTLPEEITPELIVNRQIATKTKIPALYLFATIRKIKNRNPIMDEICWTQKSKYSNHAKYFYQV